MTVSDYLDSLPDDRREAVDAVRQAILANLPDGYEEGIQYGGIGYFVPHSVCPAGYHCDPKQPVPFAGLVNGKAKISLHLFCLYTDPAAMGRFVDAWKATGKRLDMGKSCVRFRKIDDVPLDLVGEVIASVPVETFLDHYESALPEKVRKKRVR